MNITLQSLHDTNTFKYVFRNNSASKKFCQVWQNIFDNYAGTHIELTMECPTPTDSVAKLNQNIYDICADIVTKYPDIIIPDCWIQLPYTQKSLNELHDKFAENTQMEPVPALQKRLSHLNFAIHNLESRVLNEAEGRGNLPRYVSSCGAASIERQYALDLEPEDSLAYDGACFEQSVLISSYNTLGKDLQALAFDNDLTSMRNNQRYVPKTTIMSQFSMIVPPEFLTAEQLQEKRQGMQQFVDDWCEQNNTRLYGVDPVHFVNRTGRLVIADKVDATQTDWNWIMDQDSLHIQQFVIQGMGTVTLVKDDTYLIST